MSPKDKKNESQETCPKTCKDDLFGGLFHLMDKIEKEKKTSNEAR